MIHKLIRYLYNLKKRCRVGRPEEEIKVNTLLVCKVVCPKKVNKLKNETVNMAVMNQ